MKYKVWVIPEKTMYYDAQNLTDSKWNLARLMKNNHCRTCYTIGKTDKNGVDIYTYDLVLINGHKGIVKELNNGVINIKMEKGFDLEMPDIPNYMIEVVGNAWELEMEDM